MLLYPQVSIKLQTLADLRGSSALQRRCLAEKFSGFSLRRPQEVDEAGAEVDAEAIYLPRHGLDRLGLPNVCREIPQVDPDEAITGRNREDHMLARTRLRRRRA